VDFLIFGLYSACLACGLLQECCSATALSSIGYAECTRSGIYLIFRLGLGPISATDSKKNVQGNCAMGDWFGRTIGHFHRSVLCPVYFASFSMYCHAANAKKLCLGCASREMIESGLRAKLTTLCCLTCDLCFSGLGLSLFAGIVPDFA
jgi:hypothetical protein